MKIKTKLNLGVGLLFLLIILLVGVSTWYINALKRDTGNILIANYNTLQYSRNMILALDEMTTDPAAVTAFDRNLQKQQANVTEQGEREATDKVEKHFMLLKQNPADTTVRPLIRKDISELMQLNMMAIEKKSEVASETAETAIIWISITGTLCFLIAFVLLINLPGSIANPIKELTESIKQIAAQQYHQRVHFEGQGEFGELASSFNTMARKLEEYAGSKLAEILMEKKRIDTLINNMRDPVIGLDETGKMLFINDQALKIAGLRKEEVVGEDVRDIAIRNDLIRLLIRDVSRSADDTRSQPLKIYADNKESYFEKEVVDIRVIPTGESESRQIGHVIVLKNITPFKELDFAKTNFIATVSHELKTPISSIQMSIQLLEHTETGNLNMEQTGLLESIREDSQRLLSITGELLNMTQLESGNIQLNIRASDPYSILQYALDAVKTQAEQKRAHVLTETDPDIPLIKADADKTAWVLTNFLTNAIRYAPERSDVLVAMKSSGGSVLFSVKDVGIGIEPRYRDRIFDRYFQVPGSSKSGTGLGLAISKEFIEAQGGDIGVESEIGMGSRFWFTLNT